LLEGNFRFCPEFEENEEKRNNPVDPHQRMRSVARSVEGSFAFHAFFVSLKKS